MQRSLRRGCILGPSGVPRAASLEGVPEARRPAAGGAETEACTSAIHRARGSEKQSKHATGGSGKGEESSGDEEGDEGESGGSEAGSGLVAWAGEEYEEERVRGVEGSYLKYAARLRRQPLQCVRCAVHIFPP